MAKKDNSMLWIIGGVMTGMYLFNKTLNVVGNSQRQERRKIILEQKADRQISASQLAGLAIEIYESFGIVLEDEARVFKAAKQIRGRQELEFVAKVFRDKYRRSMFDYLSKLSDIELAAFYKIVDSEPNKKVILTKADVYADPDDYLKSKTFNGVAKLTGKIVIYEGNVSTKAMFEISANEQANVPVRGWIASADFEYAS